MSQEPGKLLSHLQALTQPDSADRFEENNKRRYWDMADMAQFCSLYKENHDMQRHAIIKNNTVSPPSAGTLSLYVHTYICRCIQSEPVWKALHPADTDMSRCDTHAAQYELIDCKWKFYNLHKMILKNRLAVPGHINIYFYHWLLHHKNN